MIQFCCTHCGCHNRVMEPPDHHPQPADDDVPATLAVGVTVTREIATRWNLRRYGEAQTATSSRASASSCSP
jgi:hypothetical protein